MASDTTTKVTFTLNGERIDVDIKEASCVTLNEFIRHRTRFTGTKVSCAQGGCGACTVAVARANESWKSTASCLFPLASAHGSAILTVEGLSKKDASGKLVPHPVAERLADFNGTQCGFCTPGMVMQLFSTLSQKEGGKNCEESELEHCVNGNLCRCTGYRPIVECVKSFAANSGVKNDLAPNCRTGPYDVSKDPLPEIPDIKQLEADEWRRPATLDAVLSAMRCGATPLAGGTAFGVYNDLGVVASSNKFVDVTGVPELRLMFVRGKCLHIGAAVTWSQFVKELGAIIQSGKAPNVVALEELRRRCSTIAGAQVRNHGTIGGNIAITRNKGFLSDWVPLLASLGAKVHVMRHISEQTAQFDLLAFVREESAFDGLITSISMPLPSEELVFKAYRVAERGHNAHALVNAGFAVALKDGSLKEAVLVLGAVDPKPVRLRGLEAALEGVKVAEIRKDAAGVVSTLTEKMRSVDFFQLCCGFGKEQTDHIICGFIVKFLTALFPSDVPKEWASASYNLHDECRNSSATQTFPRPLELGGDLFKPMVKTTALDQAMGLSKYTDDMPQPESTLFAAFVLCPEANASVNDISDALPREVLGTAFHSLFTYDDLMNKSINASAMQGLSGNPPQYKEEYIGEGKFCGPENYLLPLGAPSLYAGQPVAVLLAHTKQPRLVEMAASKLSQSLSVERKGPVDVGKLEGGESLCPDAFVLSKGKVDLIAPLLEKAKESGSQSYVTGRFVKSSQSHFAMEAQSVLCIPDEGGITCYSASQNVDCVQKSISNALNMPQSKVTVKMRRVGGGFGGKNIRPMIYSGLAAQMAHKTQRPVRLVLPRDAEMQLVGGRQELEATWSASVDPVSGEIKALDLQCWLGHGAHEDMQKLTAHIIGATFDMNYKIPNIKFTCNLIKQNLASRTAVRAPGHFEAVLLIESVIEGVATHLGMSAERVRERNFHLTNGTSGLNGGLLPQGGLHDYSNLAMWELMKQRTSYDKSVLDVQHFNKTNAWKKRGVSITPARYGCFLPPGNAARVDIFKDGSVQIAVTGAEIGQGLHTKVGQAVSTHFFRKVGAGPPMDVMRFLDTSTDQNPNGLGTGGSTTSEGTVYASLVAVDQLADRLKGSAKVAARRTPEKRNNKGLWFDIIEEAFSTLALGVLPVPANMSAVGMHLPKMPTDLMYETYGVAFAEVELDILSGECRVRKAHLMFDAGTSLNPMIDIGQMEGAYIMGMGQVLHEGIDYDPMTGKCLTDNTWTYKPPIAPDIPEIFHVDLVDMRSQRKNSLAAKIGLGCLGGVLECLGFPWKPSKLDKCYKSSKAIGEPPLLLAQSVHSALRQAIVAARGGQALPENLLPIPAKPFCVLPLLTCAKPGSGENLDMSSTATPQSVHK